MLQRCISWCILLTIIVLSITRNPISVKSMQACKENQTSVRDLSLLTVLQNYHDGPSICQLALVWNGNPNFIDNIFIALKKIYCNYQYIVTILDETFQVINLLRQLEDTTSVMVQLSDILKWTIFRTYQIRQVFKRMETMVQYDNYFTQKSLINPVFSLISAALAESLECKIIDSIIELIGDVKSSRDMISMIKVLSSIKIWCNIDQKRSKIIFNNLRDWTIQVHNSSDAVSMMTSLSYINSSSFDENQIGEFRDSVNNLMYQVETPQDAELMISALSRFNLMYADYEVDEFEKIVKDSIDRVETSQDAVSIFKALSCTRWKIIFCTQVCPMIDNINNLIPLVDNSSDAVLMMIELSPIKGFWEPDQTNLFFVNIQYLIDQVDTSHDAVLMMQVLSGCTWSKQPQTSIDGLFDLIKYTIDNELNTIEDAVSILKELNYSNWLLRETQRDELFNYLKIWFDQVDNSADAVLMITQISCFQSLLFGPHNLNELMNKITHCIDHVDTSRDAVSMMKAMYCTNWGSFPPNFQLLILQTITQLITQVENSQDAVMMLTVMFEKEQIFLSSTSIDNIFNKIICLIDQVNNSEQAVSMMKALSSIEWSRQHLYRRQILESKISDLILKVNNFGDAVTMISSGWQFDALQKNKLFNNMLYWIIEVNGIENALSMMMMELSTMNWKMLEENQIGELMLNIHNAIAQVECSQDAVSMTLALCLCFVTHSSSEFFFDLETKGQQILNLITELVLSPQLHYFDFCPTINKLFKS